VASVGDAKVFHNGRQFAASLGLVPRQNSTGGKTSLLGISKRGDTYLRTLLIHGARSVLFSLKRNPARADGWLARVANRRNPNIAAVALANKNARIVWALLAHGRDYQGQSASHPRGTHCRATETTSPAQARGELSPSSSGSHRRRVTGSWGCAVRRRLIAQCPNSGDLLLPRPIASFVIAFEDRPDAIVRCSPPGSGYSRRHRQRRDLRDLIAV
jgi:hypothetical protein